MLKGFTAVLSGLHLHHHRVEFRSQFGIDILHFLADPQQCLIQRQPRTQHDAQQIHRVRKRFLQLGPVTLHQPVQHLGRQQIPQQARRHYSAELTRHRIAALHIEHSAQQQQREDHLPNRVSRQCLSIADSRLSQFLLCIAHPVFAARNETDDI